MYIELINEKKSIKNKIAQTNAKLEDLDPKSKKDAESIERLEEELADFENCLKRIEETLTGTPQQAKKKSNA